MSSPQVDIGSDGIRQISARQRADPMSTIEIAGT
jgi:hypothetical protein